MYYVIAETKSHLQRWCDEHDTRPSHVRWVRTLEDLRGIHGWDDSNEVVLDSYPFAPNDLPLMEAYHRWRDERDDAIGMRAINNLD